MSRKAITLMIALVSTLSVVAAHAATPTVVPAATVSPSASPVASTTVEVAPPLAPTNLKMDLASRQITWQAPAMRLASRLCTASRA
jgi:hypothetical protein